MQEIEALDSTERLVPKQADDEGATGTVAEEQKSQQKLRTDARTIDKIVEGPCQ